MRRHERENIMDIVEADTGTPRGTISIRLNGNVFETTMVLRTTDMKKSEAAYNRLIFAVPGCTPVAR